jgi:uncharacterized protein
VTGVFADTVGLLALWDESDQWHSPAKTTFEKLTARRAALWTTTFVLLETANAAARRPYRPAVDRLRRALESAHTLITPSDSDWTEAWGAYSRGDIGSAGIVDHASFIVMRRLKLSEVFGNDQHFRTAGFHTLF